MLTLSSFIIKLTLSLLLTSLYPSLSLVLILLLASPLILLLLRVFHSAATYARVKTAN